MVLNAKSELREVFGRARSALFVVAIFSLVINLLMLTLPVYMLQVYDRVLGSGHVETLILLTLIAAVALLVMGVLEALRNSVTVRVGCWLNDRLGPVYFESGVSARLKGAGEGAEAFRHLATIQNFIATGGVIAFFDIPWAPIFIVMIWLLHPVLGMIALASAGMLLFLSFANEWVTRKSTAIASNVSTSAIRVAECTIRNSEAVRAMGFLPAMIDRWSVLNTASIDAIRRAYESGGVVLSVTKAMRFFVQVAILGVGAYLVLQGELTAGSMIAASILLGRALAPVELTIGAWKNFMQARLAYQQLAQQIDAFPPPARRTLMEKPKGRLEVSNMHYRTSNGAHILTDISFRAEPGEAIAIIGPSGAGKSSLCRLVVGLIEPFYGEVRLDGSDLRHWDHIQLGSHIGYLPQDVELFPGTVRENIARMDSDIDDNEVVEAAVTAGVHSMIQRLPQGYDTEIGDGGVRLSGGQRQRVGLARAVYRKPSIVVLDEPNANLDQAGESALADAIATLKKENCLLIIVGHRPSTLAQADKILVIKDGCVGMFGPRDEVMRALTEVAPKARSPQRNRTAINEASESAAKAEGVRA